MDAVDPLVIAQKCDLATLERQLPLLLQAPDGLILPGTSAHTALVLLQTATKQLLASTKKEQALIDAYTETRKKQKDELSRRKGTLEFQVMPVPLVRYSAQRSRLERYKNERHHQAAFLAEREKVGEKKPLIFDRPLEVVDAPEEDEKEEEDDERIEDAVAEEEVPDDDEIVEDVHEQEDVAKNVHVEEEIAVEEEIEQVPSLRHQVLRSWRSQWEERSWLGCGQHDFTDAIENHRLPQRRKRRKRRKKTTEDKMVGDGLIEEEEEKEEEKEVFELIARNEIHVGDTVYVRDGEEAILKFVGKVQFAEGDWAGVELVNGEGRNDGSVHGRRYFRCDAGRGVFVKLSTVKQRDEPDKEEKEDEPDEEEKEEEAKDEPEKEEKEDEPDEEEKEEEPEDEPEEEDEEDEPEEPDSEDEEDEPEPLIEPPTRAPRPPPIRRAQWKSQSSPRRQSGIGSIEADPTAPPAEPLQGGIVGDIESDPD